MTNKRKIAFRVIQLLLVAAIVLSLSACAMAGGGVRDIYLVEFDKWDIHSELQQQYLYGDDVKAVKKYAEGASELSYPESPEFEWYYSDKFDEDSISELYLIISEDKDFTDPLVITPRVVATSYYARKGSLNLKVNTKYYWQVQLYDDQGILHSSKVSSFKTLGGIRNISIDGVSNARDLGGYKTMDGGTVRQGLLYRSGRFNENYTLNCTVSTAGIKAIEELGINTEIDFRGNRKSVSGTMMYINGYPADMDPEEMKSVVPCIKNYIHCPIIYDDAILGTVAGKTQFKRAFEALADENNYPVIYHCSIGTDRTGAFSILIEWFLGLEEDDIVRDYLFSNFGGIGSSRAYTKYTLLISALGRCEGETRMEKAENYLLSIGVSQETMDKVRSILVEY